MIYRKHSGCISAVFTGLLFFSIQSHANPFLDIFARFALEDEQVIAENIEALLNGDGQNGVFDTDLRLDVLKEFYSSREYTPVWCGSRGPNRNARSLLKALNSSDKEGLNPANYSSRTFQWFCNSADAKQKAWSDLLFTNTFLRYGSELYSGELNPRQVDRSWHLTPTTVDPLALLQTTLQNGDLGDGLQSLQPPHKGYKRLRLALRRYTEFLKAGDWPVVPAGPLLRVGDLHDSLPLLRRRLEREGVYNPAGVIEPTLYDPDLEAAVKRFQQRYGLKVDGIIGPGTREALNVSLATRIEQLKLNMERWRWMPRDLEQRYLLVNTAAFDLQLIENRQTRLRMRVINGRRDRTTPVFKTRITHVVFNPFWTVPYRIAVKDLLPKQLEDPSYFSNQQIEVFQRIDGENVLVDPGNIDWTQYSQSYFPFLLRQRPGSHNALGRLKFLSPNRFDVYLHDTPSRSLFEKHVRTFSSGCIRLEDPNRLAALVLNTEETAILEKIDTNETAREPLITKLPIYVVYLTAWMDDNGVVHFRDDVYGKDRRLAEQKQRSAWKNRSARLEGAPTP
jgi:murein L,D-transpeptidase YcbB/YkuD